MALRGWRGVLEYLAASPRTERTAEAVGKALGITRGAAWILLERCRLFSNVRSRKEGLRRLFSITPKGKKLVEDGFERG